MRVLVTGATSLLGRVTAERLIARGDEVTVMQRRPSGLGCREVLGDIADLAVVNRAAAGQDVVVHLAAKVDVVGPWSAYMETNVSGTRHVLAACRGAGVGRLVHVSSPSVAHSGSALVGAGAGPADPERARGRYARSKAIAELEALAADSPGLAVLAVRPHLVWGPGDTQLVGRIVERATTGRLPVIGSGAALIDSTYIDNAATALVAAVDRCGRVHGEALVVSNGEPRPASELIARICRAAGVPQPRRKVPLALAWLAGAAVETVWASTGRQSTPPITRFVAEQLATSHWFDQRRTRSLLAWRPEVSLDQGFTRLSAWYDSSAAARESRPPVHRTSPAGGAATPAE